MHPKSHMHLTHVIYLCDFELSGCLATGLDLINELEISGRSLLVTSRYEDHLILEQCKKLGVCIIPKNVAGFVPVRINTSRVFSPPT